MDAHWLNRRPGYRCRHGHISEPLTGQTTAASSNVGLMSIRIQDVSGRDSRSHPTSQNFARRSRLGPTYQNAKTIITVVDDPLSVSPIRWCRSLQ